ncbi:MAG: hypothetical protein IPN10_02555 [Saprospiraceae bacterium]|nr:hypothetical protein [Saprospiraceae bacterium]
MWSNIRKYVQNGLGPRFDKHYLIIESDDWGTVRMPSKKVYNDLKKEGCSVDNNPFTKFDSLESNDDLERLFSILIKYKDKTGRHPIITADTIVANPSFEKIIENGFLNYEYEPFIETLKRYPAHNRVMDLYREGIASGFFYPEYHGREHVNINLWMKEVRKNNTIFRLAAKLGTFAIDLEGNNDRYKKNFMATCHMEDESEINDIKNNLGIGLNLFSDIFGYRARSFIALLIFGTVT